MKENELIVGEIYQLDWGSCNKWIIQFSGNILKTPYLHAGNYSSSGSFPGYEWKLASNSDKNHLLACIAANKYTNIPKPPKYVIY